MALIDEMIAMKRLAESFVQGCEKIIRSMKQASEEIDHGSDLFGDLEDLIEVRKPEKKARIRRTEFSRPYRCLAGMVRIDNLGAHYRKNTKEMREVCIRLGVRTEKVNSHHYIDREATGHIVNYLERMSNQIKSE